MQWSSKNNNCTRTQRNFTESFSITGHFENFNWALLKQENKKSESRPDLLLHSAKLTQPFFASFAKHLSLGEYFTEKDKNKLRYCVEKGEIYRKFFFQKSSAAIGNSNARTYWNCMAQLNDLTCKKNRISFGWLLRRLVPLISFTEGLGLNKRKSKNTFS